MLAASRGLPGRRAQHTVSLAAKPPDTSTAVDAASDPRQGKLVRSSRVPVMGLARAAKSAGGATPLSTQSAGHEGLRIGRQRNGCPSNGMQTWQQRNGRRSNPSLTPPRPQARASGGRLRNRKIKHAKLSAALDAKQPAQRRAVDGAGERWRWYSVFTVPRRMDA